MKDNEMTMPGAASEAHYPVELPRESPTGEILAALVIVVAWAIVLFA